jgi:hypothetical protein
MYQCVFPVISNTLDAKTAAVGDSVIAVPAKDPEGSTVTYSLQQSPNSGIFTINPSQSTISGPAITAHIFLVY